MMVSVETVLLRGKRRINKWLAVPWVRMMGFGAMFVGGGFLLSGASLWGEMQPLVLGLIYGAPGWPGALAAAGSILGYPLFWGLEGLQGAVWSAGGLMLSLVLPFWGRTDHRREQTAASAACLVSGAGLAFQYRFGQSVPFPVFLLRIGLAGFAAVVGEQMLEKKNRVVVWSAGALGVLALANIRSPTWCNPGLVAAGAAIAAVPLPGAVLLGFGAELSGAAKVPLAAGAGLAYFMQQLPVRKSFRRYLAPAAGIVSAMMLSGQWNFGALLPLTAGVLLGGNIPWRVAPLHRRSGLGGAQVQLEQTAQVLLQLQRQLLEYIPPPVVPADIMEELRHCTCGECPAEQGCREKKRLTEAVLESQPMFPCRKAEHMAAQIRESRDRLKRMKLSRAVQAEYRTALAKQYGFLSDLLSSLSDRLPERIFRGQAKYRVQISSRSRGRNYTDGDRVLAFPGAYCRYYVVLCDGMGTGFGAAEEGRQAAGLLRNMLSAGISPSGALGGLNSQLTLLGRGGAVTVDLAELRLDSGTVWMYKWGASPSWLLGHGRAERIGEPSVPPGMEIGASREQITRLALGHGQVLVMLSDGVEGERAALWAQDIGGEPGILAQRIVAESSGGEDDATAVVIRMVDLHE